MFLDSFDNTKLYYEKTEAKNKLGVVIIVHGLGENLKRYDTFISKLVDEGYICYAFDLRGHGRSEGKRGYAKSYMDFIFDVDMFVSMAKREYPTLKCFLFGHSMGGFIVNAYGVSYENKVCGIISSAAPGIYLKMVRPLKLVNYHIFGFINHKNNLGRYLSHDQNICSEYEKSELNLKKIKIRLLGTMFVSGIKYLQTNIKKFKYDVLYLHGTSDKIVEVASSKWLYENVSSKDKKIILYEGFYHEILNEIGKEKVIWDIVDWLKKH